jgi:hypothetical protein
MFGSGRGAKKATGADKPDKAVKAEAGAHKLRSSHTTTHFELGQDGKPKAYPTTPLSGGNLKLEPTALGLASPAATGPVKAPIVPSAPSKSSVAAPSLPAAGAGASKAKEPPVPAPPGVAAAAAAVAVIPEVVEPAAPVVHAPVEPVWDDDDMAESGLNPPLFTGTSQQDAAAWHQNLLDFIDFKSVAADKRLPLFKIRLTGAASDWLLALPDDQKDTFDHLTAAFLERYKPKEIEKYRYAKELFGQKQEANESVDLFLTKLKKKAEIAGVDVKSQIFAALNGLRPEIASFVLEHPPLENLDDVLKHARLAEITRGTISRANENTVVQHLSCISDEMTRMNAKLNQMTTTATTAATAQPDTLSCNAFDEQPARQQQRPQTGGSARSPFRPDRQQSWGNRGFRNQGRTGPPPAAMSGRGAGEQKQQPQAAVKQPTPRQQCTRCGRAPHQNDLYCPMRDRTCFSCGKRGHAHRMCRSRQPDNRQQY